MTKKATVFITININRLSPSRTRFIPQGGVHLPTAYTKIPCASSLPIKIKERIARLRVERTARRSLTTSFNFPKRARIKATPKGTAIKKGIKFILDYPFNLRILVISNVLYL